MIDEKYLMSAFTLLGFSIINLIILGLNLKLYTEYFKDRSISKRKEP